MYSLNIDKYSLHTYKANTRPSFLHIQTSFRAIFDISDKIFYKKLEVNIGETHSPYRALGHA